MPKKGSKRGERENGWTRSFPSGSIEGQDWMVAVLDDLHAYATTHDMTDIAENLLETRRTVLAHLHSTRH